MIPNLDLQLQVVMKALSEVVGPALDPSQNVAHEQLGLAIATLGMVRQHLPLEQAREWRALADAKSLAETICAACDHSDLAALVVEAQTLLEAGNPVAGARRSATERLLAAISEVSRAPDTPWTILALILQDAKPSTDLARAWCLSAGFEPDPDEVPTLSELLSRRA